MREQVWPERGRQRLGPAAVAGIAAPEPGAALGTRSARGYGLGGIAWRPRASLRQRLAGWRARNWRRAILAWFALSLTILVIAAEPRSDFPKAQASSVPAARMILRVADGVTVAVPFLLIVLP